MREKIDLIKVTQYPTGISLSATRVITSGGGRVVCTHIVTPALNPYLEAQASTSTCCSIASVEEAHLCSKYMDQISASCQQQKA